MRSNTIVLAIGLLATPLSLLAAPDAPSPTLIAFPAEAAVAPETVNGHALTPAPMPTVGPAGVAPVDRAAGPGSRSLSAGPINSTPFSDTPSGTLSSGGDQIAQRDRSLAPADAAGVTPNLGR